MSHRNKSTANLALVSVHRSAGTRVECLVLLFLFSFHPASEVLLNALSITHLVIKKDNGKRKRRKTPSVIAHWFQKLFFGMANRPLALRGHVTSASFKQWVGILLMPKIDRAHKNYLTPEIWEEMHLREIFYDTLIFQQSIMICIGRHVGGHTLAFQHGGQNHFLLISC